MTFTVNSYATTSADSKLAPYTLERRDLLDDDLLVKVKYAGICHSDIHVSHGDWGETKHPLVPGHEIVGTVEKVGSKVSKHKVGDIVAIGCMVDSCRECAPCKGNEEIFCLKGCTQTYGSPEARFPGRFTAGGYSEKIVVSEHFALHTPAALQTPDLLPGVAPILCAGITLYSPLREHNVQSGQKVGIVGLGGLGHMGVKLAKAMGTDVSVISRSHKKDAEAKNLGASHVVASTVEEDMKAAAGTYDLIIDTIPFDHDVNQYMALLKNHKTLVVVGHVGPFAKNPVSSFPLIFGNRRIAGSCIGGIKETQELLEFCAKHKIIAEYDMITMDKANDAWDTLMNGDHSSRFIIDIDQYTKANGN